MSKTDRREPLTDGDPNAEAEWTIMIYMAGDNNLAEDCVNALMALKSLNTGDDIHVTAQFDPGDPRISTRRMVINRRHKRKVVDGLVTHLLGKLDEDRVLVRRGARRFPRLRGTREVVPHDDGVLETDTSDPETLFDFISWSSEKFPAKRYMLVLCGHAAGVEAGFLLKDEHPAQAMKLDALKDVLTEVRQTLNIKLDILGMDSCLMSMVEICYELQDLVNVFVGSQSMTPNPGWPYAEIVRIMKDQNGKIKAEDLAPEMVHAYIRSYVDQSINSGTSTDLAALRMDKARDVADEVKKLAKALSDDLKDSALLPVFKPALVLSHWEAQSYNGELFVDMADFCELLANHLESAGATATGNGALTAAIKKVTDRCKDVQEAIGKMVLEACFCGIDYQYSNGVSIYFPWSTIFFDYRNFAFAKAEGANWFRFLRDYIEGTRRKPRGEQDKDSEDGDISQAFVVFDSNLMTRKVEPISHGPTGPAHSMRNPPRRIGKRMIKGCRVLKNI